MGQGFALDELDPVALLVAGEVPYYAEAKITVVRKLPTMPSGATAGQIVSTAA